jgi:hypothetical protein
MADRQHKLSRRALLGAPLVPLILSGAERCRSALSKDASPLVRHPGLGSHQSSTLMGSLDPGSTFSSPAPEGRRWIPDQVRDDGKGQSFAVTIWDRALASFLEAQAILDAARSEPDQDAYDALPAPDLPAFAAKLDHITAHLAWELTGSEDCLEILRRDAHRFAATGL